MFSSPTGELSFYPQCSPAIASETLFFVPYRGTKFLSGDKQVIKIANLLFFVPYRGTKFLSLL